MEITRSLWVPKEGNTDLQYEDASADTLIPDGARLIAVADGASAAVFARNWAQILTKGFTNDTLLPSDDDAFFAKVTELGDLWRAEVGASESGGKARAWWAEEKIPQGSAASLLLVHFGLEKWTALGVGDVCLFAVENDRLKWSFPLTKSKQFSNRPALLTTDLASLKERPKVIRHSAPIAAGTRYFLLTDALSHWFLSEHEKRKKPWEILPETPETFASWVAARRTDRSLHNDDVTLIEIR